MYCSQRRFEHCIISKAIRVSHIKLLCCARGLFEMLCLIYRGTLKHTTCRCASTNVIYIIYAAEYKTSKWFTSLSSFKLRWAFIAFSLVSVWCTVIEMMEKRNGIQSCRANDKVPIFHKTYHTISWSYRVYNYLKHLAVLTRYRPDDNQKIRMSASFFWWFDMLSDKTVYSFFTLKLSLSLSLIETENVLPI